MSLPVNRELIFNLFKYSIYLLLTVNTWLFFVEESLAVQSNYPDGVPFSKLISAYSSTIDTFAWVILLWVFELETAIIPDDKLKGRLKWWLLGLRGACYTVVFYAVFGYFNEYMLMSDFHLNSSITDACALIGQNFGMIPDADNIIPLTAENCNLLINGSVYQISGTQTLGNLSQLQQASSVALTDVINSHTWVLILVILEVDVFLQLKGINHSRLITISNVIKGLLYTALLGCAIYWGFKGDFLDFWDAFLWLVAFIFIELNIFNWREETDSEMVTDTESEAVSK